jgi:hypothetical protein
MVRSAGEVSRLDAMAQKARAWFRDLMVMVFGVGGEENALSAGRQSATSGLLKLRRLERHEDFVQNRTHFTPKDIMGGQWQSVDSLAFAGVLWDQGEYDQLLENMNALRLQVALITDFHEFNLFERMMASEVSIRSLGGMKSQFKDFALLGTLHLDADTH